jgi:hyperosmotically inducible protein
MKHILVGLAALSIAASPALAPAQTTTDKIEKKTERAADKVEQKTERAADKAERKADSAGDKAKATTEKAKTGTKDAWLVSKTKIALYADERVHGTSVNVDAKNGVVTLRGKVTSADEKKAAEEVAKSVEGVSSVKNNLQVVSAAEKKAVDRKDDDLKKAVKDRIGKDARLKGSDIEVRADKGVVTLVGDAKDIGARARASELARGVPGVKSVKNELKEKS